MKEKSVKNIKIAFLVNLFFSIFELIGGLLTNSISIILDSFHDFSDSISIIVAYFFEKKSQKKADSKYTYGYLRYSLIGALITSLFLAIASVFVLYHAIPRLANPADVNYDGMFIFAIFGVIVNGYAAYRTSKGNGTNEKAVSLHMLEDVLGWVAILLGSILMKIFNAPIIDPILSIIIGVFMLYNAIKSTIRVTVLFMDKVPSGMDIKEVSGNLKKEFHNIVDIHHIHIWTIDGINNFITLHVVVKDDASSDEIIKLKKNIKENLSNQNIKHANIEIEYNKEDCGEKEEFEITLELSLHGHHHHY